MLGDFANAQLEHFGVATSFFRDGAKFIVRTDGPDGALHDYQIAYTFGVYPLQQYLVAFPGGRLQAFGIAWDSRPDDQGGQRWVRLYPGQQLKLGDPLHWTDASLSAPFPQGPRGGQVGIGLQAAATAGGTVHLCSTAGSSGRRYVIGTDLKGTSVRAGKTGFSNCGCAAGRFRTSAPN